MSFSERPKTSVHENYYPFACRIESEFDRNEAAMASLFTLVRSADILRHLSGYLVVQSATHGICVHRVIRVGISVVVGVDRGHSGVHLSDDHLNWVYCRKETFLRGSSG